VQHIRERRGRSPRNPPDVILDLQNHHGEVKNNQSTFTGDFVLEVIGMTLRDDVTNALRAFDFSSFVETPKGFTILPRNWAEE
jgi:hypothetical protein